MNKWLKISLIILSSLIGFILLVLLFGTLFGGCVAKNYVNNHTEDILGRRGSVEHVGMNLFTGHVAVNGLAIYEDNGTDKFAGFDTLDVDISLLRLLGQTVYLRHITLSGLDVRVLQNGSRFNFSSMLEFLQSDTTETEEPQDTTPSPWVISLHNIRFSNGRANYHDVQRNSNWGFKDLDLHVPDFSIGGSEQTDAGLTLEFENGGVLQAQAFIDGRTSDFDISVGLDHFELDQIKPYIVNVAYIDRLQGHLKLNANAKGNLADFANAAIAAKVNLDNVDIRDLSHMSVASMNHFAVDVKKIVPAQNLYDINSIEITGLKTRYELFDDSTNTFSRLLAPSTSATDSASMQTDSVEAPAPEADTVPAPELKLRVGHLALRDMAFTFADHTLKDDFVFPITDIKIEADDISSRGNNNARVFAKMPNGGVTMVKWAGNINHWKEMQRLSINIKGLHITDLSPYMVEYFGMPFADGVFSFSSINTINHSQLNGKNEIDIYKPEFGEKRTDVKPRLHLPVRAALYILKDKDEKVNLSVPVSGNVDNPKFSYMKMVWKTLGNLIIKVATSPARLLGSDASVNENGEVFIEVDMEEPSFTSEQLYQIDQLAEIAKNDEFLMLSMELQVRNAKDSVSHQRHNNILQHHLVGLGVPEKQIEITTAQPNRDVKKEGYVVATRYKE